MIPALITVLIYALVFGVLWWVFTSLIPLPEPFGRVAQVIIVLIFLLLIVGILFGHVPLLNMRL
jgi:hypothetical protein